MRTAKKTRFRAIYTTFGAVDAVVNTAARNGVSVLVIRHPLDGGDPHWRSDTCQSLVADLQAGEDLLAVMAVIWEWLPDAVVFTTAIDRDVASLRTEPGETEIIQELLWLHAGRGRIVETYYPGLNGGGAGR